MNIRQLLITLVVSATFTCPALAERSASEFLKQYDAGDLAKRAVIEQWASAAEAGMGWSNTYLRGTKQPEIYCLPDSLVVTGNQLMDMVRRQAETKKRIADAPFGLAILYALKDVFPCKGP